MNPSRSPERSGRSSACCIGSCAPTGGASRTGRATDSAIVFSLLSWPALYLILRNQGIHPWNPQRCRSGTWNVSFNTAASLVTNTNWQDYAGETTLSSFSQMAGLAVQNFVSAAVGMAVMAAVIRGLARRSGKTLGNFSADPIRSLLYVLAADQRRRRAVPRLAVGSSGRSRRPSASRRRPAAPRRSPSAGRRGPRRSRRAGSRCHRSTPSL